MTSETDVPSTFEGLREWARGHKENTDLKFVNVISSVHEVRDAVRDLSRVMRNATISVIGAMFVIIGFFVVRDVLSPRASAAPVSISTPARTVHLR